jgi:hypothetical protein
MLNDDMIAGETPAERDTAVGIVVHDNRPAPRRPRSIAFVWGGEDAPAPSLPFGRWKPARAA